VSVENRSSNPNNSLHKEKETGLRPAAERGEDALLSRGANILTPENRSRNKKKEGNRIPGGVQEIKHPGARDS